MQKSILNELLPVDLPQAKKDQLLAKMTEILLKKFFIDALGKLDEKDKDEYEKMIDRQPSSEEIEKFLQGKISDYDKMLDAVVADFKKEMAKV